MIEVRQANIDDAVSVSSLLMANSSERGGMLYGDWGIGVVTEWITSGALIAIAIDGPKLMGVLFTSEKAQASAAAVADAQVEHLGIAQDVPSAEGRHIRLVGQPFTLSRTPSKMAARPPEFGEQTEEVLAEFGFTAEEVASLRQKKVV